jgi:hypothetical protein
MRTLVAFSLAISLAGPAAAQSEPKLPLETKTIELKHLRPDEAVNLLKPYIVNSWGTVTSVSPNMPIVTIKDVAENIGRMEKVLAKYDHSPATIRLVFQLIEADTGPRLATVSNSRALSSDLDATLRSVLRFSSYRLIGQGMATSGEDSRIYQKLALADSGGWIYTYDISAQLGAIRLSDVTLQAQMARTVRASSGPIEVDTTATGSVNLAVTLYRKTESGEKAAAPLIETRLDLPLGHTVVLGTAATQRGGVALILTVKPELVTSK